MEIIIKNGYVVTAVSSFQADVKIINGKIVQIGQKISTETCNDIIDASGLMVLPGAVDAHTHLEMEMARTYSADSYESGTRAAACGGVTTVFDYTLQEKGGSILSMIKERDMLCAPAACVDYTFHGGISDVNSESLEEMADIVRAGIPSFKAYMTYDFGLNDADLARVLRRSKEIGALITVHAENKGMIEANVERFISEGHTDVWYHYLSRSEEIEAEADNRAIIMARNIGAPLYIVHLANEEGVRLVARARQTGYPVFAETCPQYLHFTSDVYKKPDGIRYICSPPIKGKKSQQALWEGINNGTITTVATDHCPSQSYEKDWGKNDFRLAPNGCMGVENLYPYMLSEANQGHISFQKAVEVCAVNPAKIFGCFPIKGSIEPGSDADIVLYDPKKEFTITNSRMHSDIDYTIWEGVKLKGYPVRTIVRGKTVFKDGEFVGIPGYGKFVRRKPIRFKTGFL